MSIYQFKKFFTDKKTYKCKCGAEYPVDDGGCMVCGRVCPVFRIENYIDQSMRLPYSVGRCRELNIQGFFEAFGIPLASLVEGNKKIKITDGGGVWFDRENLYLGVSQRRLGEGAALTRGSFLLSYLSKTDGV